jgi:hypothetical protein
LTAKQERRGVGLRLAKGAAAHVVRARPLVRGVPLLGGYVEGRNSKNRFRRMDCGVPFRRFAACTSELANPGLCLNS